MSAIKQPIVFISYSHDSDAHKEWVLKLASKLVENGVDVFLDQWDIQLGSNLTSFMEKGLSDSDRVLIICTDSYNNKANAGMGGVGYEKNILTAELYQDQHSTKYIPCIRNVNAPFKTPVVLGGRVYLDFSNDDLFDTNFNSLIHELYGIPLKPKPQLGKNPFASSNEDDQPSIGGQSSTVFFSNRFAKSFPGVRGIEWFKNPKEAIERLHLFFSPPFSFKDSDPIWWWRTGDMHIDSFEQLDENTVLIDNQEFIIDEVAAVNSGSYYQSFIYIKTKASDPTGLYPIPIDKQVEYWGYAWEEFGLFRGKPIRRSELDDGAAVIDGKVINLNNEAEVRVRYLSPYNLIIAPHGSPINNNNFDQKRKELLNGILHGKNTLEELTKEILSLPKRERGAL